MCNEQEPQIESYAEWGKEELKEWATQANERVRALLAKHPEGLECYMDEIDAGSVILWFAGDRISGAYEFITVVMVGEDNPTITFAANAKDWVDGQRRLDSFRIHYYSDLTEDQPLGRTELDTIVGYCGEFPNRIPIRHNIDPLEVTASLAYLVDNALWEAEARPFSISERNP